MEISESEAIILDSSVWVAYLHQEDSQHGKVMKLVDTLPNATMVPTEILSEVATVLKNKRREDLANAFVRSVIIDGSSLLVSDENLVRRVAKTFLESGRGNLSFADITLLVLSREYRVITFDKELENAISKYSGQ